jgi:flagellar basal-body rod protein FlgF
MAGAAARAEQLDSIADNLANAQSPGFKASRPAFQSFLAGSGPTDKVFTAAVATGTDLTPGDTVVTDNPLDVLPEGNGFMAVMSGLKQIAYTRNGQLKVGEGNTLISDGHPVLGVDGKSIILPPQTMPTISPDGIVIAGGRPIARMALFKLEGNVERIGPSLYGPGPSGTATAIAKPVFRVGELEMGNATPLEAAVGMISAQRHFESAMQAIATYKRMDERAIEIGRVR